MNDKIPPRRGADIAQRRGPLMNRLKLVRPDAAHEAQVMDYRCVFLENGEYFAGCAGLEDVENYAEWLDFENRLSKKYGDGYVPSSVFLAVRTEDETLAGILEIRHRLTPFLLRRGGHIGYSVLPSQRRRGCATEMLRLALEECRKLDLDRVLLTCGKANVASARTIAANGGVLENEIEDDAGMGRSGTIQRYWIAVE